jgi:hypothetical protein
MPADWARRSSSGSHAPGVAILSMSVSDVGHANPRFTVFTTFELGHFLPKLTQHLLDHFYVFAVLFSLFGTTNFHTNLEL